MRQYDDPVEVRRGEAEDPDQFLWRGRLWKVRAVVAHWVETGPWWQSGTVRAEAPTTEAARAGGAGDPGDAGGLVDLVAERELWRVEAGRGMAGLQLARPGRADDTEGETYGVFDLSFDWTDGRWQLVGCLD